MAPPTLLRTAGTGRCMFARTSTTKHTVHWNLRCSAQFALCVPISVAQLEARQSVDELNQRHLHVLERQGLLELELHDHRDVNHRSPEAHHDHRLAVAAVAVARLSSLSLSLLCLLLSLFLFVYLVTRSSLVAWSLVCWAVCLFLGAVGAGVGVAAAVVFVFVVVILLLFLLLLLLLLFLTRAAEEQCVWPQSTELHRQSLSLTVAGHLGVKTPGDPATPEPSTTHSCESSRAQKKLFCRNAMTISTCNHLGSTTDASTVHTSQTSTLSVSPFT